jgi:hypothetical protein
LDEVHDETRAVSKSRCLFSFFRTVKPITYGTGQYKLSTDVLRPDIHTWSSVHRYRSFPLAGTQPEPTPIHSPSPSSSQPRREGAHSRYR